MTLKCFGTKVAVCDSGTWGRYVLVHGNKTANPHNLCTRFDTGAGGHDPGPQVAGCVLGEEGRNSAGRTRLQVSVLKQPKFDPDLIF